MSDETTRTFLSRREKELHQQIAMLDAQILLRKGELEEIARLKATLEAEDKQTEAAIFSYATASLVGTGGLAVDASVVLSFEKMTIKELVVQALNEHFKQGVTSAELRDFIRAGYGRMIEPSSLRPQLKRLKDDGFIAHDPARDVWVLTKAGHRYGKGALARERAKTSNSLVLQVLEKMQITETKE